MVPVFSSVIDIGLGALYFHLKFISLAKVSLANRLPLKTEQNKSPQEAPISLGGVRGLKILAGSKEKQETKSQGSPKNRAARMFIGVRPYLRPSKHLRGNRQFSFWSSVSP